MKKLIQTFIILIITLTSSCFGQQKEVFGANFSISEEIKTEGGIGHGLIGSDGKFTYTMGSKGFVLYFFPIGIKFIVNKWDEKMNLVAVEKIPMKTDDYKLSLYKPGEMHLVGDKFIHLVSNTNRSNKTEEVFVVEYDKTTFEIKEKRKIAGLDYEKKSKSEVYFLESKDNLSEFGVLSLIQKGEITEVSFLVLDSDLNFDLERKIEINASIDDIRFSNFSIEGDNISLVVAEEDENGNVEAMTFHMYSRSSDTHLKLPLKIRDLDNQISDFQATINDDGKLFLSGFYEANENTNTIGGAFTQLYDLREEVLINQNLSPFDFDFITSSYSDRAKNTAAKKESKGKSFDPFTYYVREVIANSDGSSTLVGECYRQYTTSYTDAQGRSHSTTYYVHGDIILMRTNKDGEIEWVKKHQRSFISSSPLLGGFILKDRNEESFNILYSTGGLTMLNVNKNDGTFQVKTVYSHDEIGNNLSLIMSNPSIMDNDKILIQASRLKRTKVITIEFDEE